MEKNSCLTEAASIQGFSQNQKVSLFLTESKLTQYYPRTRTIFANKTIMFTGPRYWNELPSDISGCLCVSSFKRKLKQLLLNGYTWHKLAFSLTDFCIPTTMVAAILSVTVNVWLLCSRNFNKHLILYTQLLLFNNCSSEATVATYSLFRSTKCCVYYTLMPGW